MKEDAKTNEDKIKATEADEAAKEKRRELANAKFTQAHLWEKVPTQEQLIKRIQNWNSKIAKMEMDLKHKDDNKEVSLGTSKVKNNMIPSFVILLPLVLKTNTQSKCYLSLFFYCFQNLFFSSIICCCLLFC